MKKFFVIGLACLLFSSISTLIFAAETNAPAPGKAVPAQLEGKIVALDKNARVMTVDIKGTLIKVHMTVNVKLTKSGKSAVFENLAPGQSILISFVEMPNGRIEVASLAVEGGAEAIEPAGSKPANPRPSNPNNTYWGVAPYGLPNPANVSGNTTSPSK
jgi:hypothetical protein